MIYLMVARVRRRAGWSVIAAAVAGVSVDIGLVGLNQASAIASVGGFLVAVIGLTLTRRSADPQMRGRSYMIMSDVTAGKDVAQHADVTPGEDNYLVMTRATAQTGSARQRRRVIPARANSAKQDGDHDV